MKISNELNDKEINIVLQQYDKSLGDLIVKMGMEEIAAGDNYDDKS